MIKTILNTLFPALKLAKGLNVAAAMVGAAAVGAVGSNMAAGTAADAQASAAANANAPWSQAQPYLTSGYSQAQSALSDAQGMGTYSGERQASLNPYQTQGANSTAAYAQGSGANTANQFYNSGTGMLNQGQQYGANGQSLLNQAQGNSGQNMQGFINAGNQLAGSQTTQNMIDSANLSTSRDLNETQLPSLMLQSEGQGGNDNTRTGIAQGLLESQAQQNMLANASNIQGQMFNTGMSAAQNQYNTQQTQALNANQQVGNAYSMGSQSLLNGQQANGNNFDQMQAAGGVFQNQQQAQDAAAQAQFTAQQQTPMSLIAQYQGIINGQYGGQAVSSVGPSVGAATLQGALGGGMSGAGLSQMLGGYNNGATAGNGNNTYGFSTGLPSEYGMSTGSSGNYSYTDPSYGASLGY